jgi:hypothetical protein
MTKKKTTKIQTTLKMKKSRLAAARMVQTKDLRMKMIMKKKKKKKNNNKKKNKKTLSPLVDG